jgi:ABC-type transport system substrate-binding protein
MRFAFLVGVIGALAALTAACGGEAATATPAPTATRPAAQPTAVPATSTPAPATATRPAAQPTAVPATSTPAPATATQAPKGPVGNFVLGEILIDPPVFMPSKQGTGNLQLLMFWGFFEPLLWAQHSEQPKLEINTDKFNAGVAESWSIAGDSSNITFKVRKGVKFHGNNGEVDALDVCFSLGDAIKDGSTNQRAAGIQRFVSAFECPDATTVVMKIKDSKIDPQWHRILSNNTLGSPVIVSKKLFDTLGEAKFTTTAVGTGVMEPTEWVAGDHITAKPNATHYRQAPKIASYKVVLMPEPATRIAALKTGQVTAARVPLKLITTAKNDIPGSWSRELGPPINQVVMFGGNYWAEKDPATGEDIYRKRPGFLPDAQHPWIGDPANEASMEKARKVRQALTMAIDRAAIVKEIQSGIGRTLTTVTNAFPGDPHWSDDFAIKYDVAAAKQLLSDAGYPSCFSFSVFVAPGKEWDVEVGAAVAQFWRLLGCNVTIDQSDYAAVRPLLVQRKRDNPWMIQVGTNGQPDENHAANYRPSPGFNLAVEVPIAVSDVSFRNLNLAATTRDQRIANTKEFQAYITKWALAAPVSTLPASILFRPEVVQYSPYMNNGPEFVAPETLVMSK